MTSENYPIMQTNGQRIYKPFSLTPAPPKGSEIFVGNIPSDLFEDALVPLFAQVGPIYKFRLMMDFSGSNRGFAFVTYYTLEDAKLAIMIFNKYHIRSRKRSSFLTVHPSLDNCRLYFGNIAKNMKSEEIEKELKKVINGVVKVFVYPEINKPELNRGFAFVEFQTHALAAIAKRQLLAGVEPLWVIEGDKKIYVDWAEPEPFVDPQVQMQVKILFLQNLPIAWTPYRFKNFVGTILRGLYIERVYKKDNYAFIHFYDRRSAESALEILRLFSELLAFPGERMVVEWARPRNYSKKNRINEISNNFCKSVPPRLRQIAKKTRQEKRMSLASSTSSGGGNCVRNERTVGDDLLAAQFARLSFYPFQ